ncbi:MAG TPA: energy transducer TonB [Bryobacteraceae bacterium]|nr:energy transducer TonB [Bryobacteraceae bacterium]
MPTAKSQTLSIGLHLAAVAMLLFLTSRSIQPPPPVIPPNHHITVLAPLRRVHLKQTDEHAGGSNQTALPAKHGQPPPQAHRTFIRPPIPEPKLPMPITVAFPSPTIAISYPDMGDPLSKYRDGMLGKNGGIGIGDVRGGIGIGPGGDKSGIARSTPGHAVSAPELIHKVEPEFSEDARKAKYSGIVLLAIEVDANGRPRAFQILQGPGLGLEQKAIEAVRQWRFKPGYQDGRPVVTGATVEVRFQLL